MFTFLFTSLLPINNNECTAVKCMKWGDDPYITFHKPIMSRDEALGLQHRTGQGTDIDYRRYERGRQEELKRSGETEREGERERDGWW